jgi:8-oxo-dGTP pyrophosphatase MutT (NUDIX family)
MAEPAAVGPWRRLTRRSAYANPWLEVLHDDVLRPDGSPGIYGVVHLRNAAVGIVVRDEDDRVLLVGQYRYTLDEYSWEIPEGGVPFEESLLEGARRELREETGFEAAEWRELFRFSMSNSVTDEVGAIFLATGLTPGELTDVMSIAGLTRVALERARRP